MKFSDDDPITVNIISKILIAIQTTIKRDQVKNYKTEIILIHSDEYNS